MNIFYLLIISMLFSAGEETADWVPLAPTPVPTPTTTPSPGPSPTPAIISLEFYFRRPAKIIPIHGREGEFEIAQEVPWLTEKDIAYISPPEVGEPMSLYLHLTPDGNQKYREAMMGNVGRTIIFSLGGTVRYTSKMVPVERKNRILVYGDFTIEEAKRFADQINSRPAPTPPPVPTPSPSMRQRFIIE